MSPSSPIPEYDPADDGDSGSPLVDALNRLAKNVPVLFQQREVEAFMKSIEGLPDASERCAQFVREIAARYERWAEENGTGPN